MVHKTSRKPRPTPLKDVQVAVQADEARRYLVLDAHSSLPSPAYPFEQQTVPSTPLSPPLHEDHFAWQVRARASNGSPTCTPPCVVSHLLDSLSSTPPLARVKPSVVLSSRTPNNRWNDSLESQDDNCIDSVPLDSLRPYRSLTPPISPPVSSPPGIDTEYSSKRSGMTFALVPAEVGGKHVFTHVVVNCPGNDSGGNSGPPSIPSGEDGLPEDMQDILRQLDDLASWVKAASSRDCISSIKTIVHATRLTGHPGTDAGGDSTSRLSGGPFPNKGKNRSLSAAPNSMYDTRHEFVVCTTFHCLANALKIIKHPGILKRCHAR
ncbi:hypothetical protein J3R82DRAFT_2475 [Butyriboletus roseoflavus]|nr:hypothetical protein J3R82DRAFT_2475 [Butyriboletus roseoflavus]